MHLILFFGKILLAALVLGVLFVCLAAVAMLEEVRASRPK